jgi:membrane-associated protease RseP (regulator of RpoE activity)
MTTGNRDWARGAWRVLAIGAFALAVWPAEGQAVAPQVGTQDAECRCVDVDGNAIEDCTCFRMPRIEALMAPFAGRPRLGLSVSTDQTGEIDAQGARVSSVMRDGPAYDAGLREGDVITRLDGRSLLEPLSGDAEQDFDLDESIPVQRLLALARELEEGHRVEVEYLRGGERSTATVVAEDLMQEGFAYQFDAERLRDQLRDVREGMRGYDFRFVPPDAPEIPEMRFFQGGGAAPFALGSLAGARYGLELVELNAGLSAYFGTEQGVLVTDIEEGSALGLEPGDVVLRVGDREVTSPERLIRILGTYGNDEQVTFRVRRRGSEIDVLGRLGG